MLSLNEVEFLRGPNLFISKPVIKLSLGKFRDFFFSPFKLDTLISNIFEEIRWQYSSYRERNLINAWAIKDFTGLKTETVKQHMCNRWSNPFSHCAWISGLKLSLYWLILEPFCYSVAFLKSVLFCIGLKYSDTRAVHGTQTCIFLGQMFKQTRTQMYSKCYFPFHRYSRASSGRVSVIYVYCCYC